MAHAFQNPREGFRIESPDAFVPWGISEGDLLAMFGDRLKRVTDGYFVMECTSLTGLRHMLGFHFRPRINGKLTEFEFFRRSYPSLTGSFEEFQHHLELTFGEPSVKKISDSYEWHFDGVDLKHYIIDRFGPEEHAYLSIATPL
jgi:hypothetical protein